MSGTSSEKTYRFLVTVRVDSANPSAPDEDAVRQAIEDELTGPAPEEYGLLEVVAETISAAKWEQELKRV